jgi:hypothetical protein
MGISGARRRSKRGTDGPAFAVRLGSVNVPVYRTEGNGRLRFFVTLYRDGLRVRRSFTNPEDAKEEARLMARKIMAGQSQGTDLSAPEREAYLAAKNLLEVMGCCPGFRGFFLGGDRMVTNAVCWPNEDSVMNTGQSA